MPENQVFGRAVGGGADEVHAVYRKGKRKLCIEFYL